MYGILHTIYIFDSQYYTKEKEELQKNKIIHKAEWAWEKKYNKIHTIWKTKRERKYVFDKTKKSMSLISVKYQTYYNRQFDVNYAVL